jgi:hypothetical protein
MLRMESETGWWLTTHQDHARLASAIAAAWGNEKFRRPEPRDRVLLGISSHNDGWTERDAHPAISRDGKPAASSVHMAGEHAAFEEIDILDYLTVRDKAVRAMAEKDPYAALLISMHTHNLLTEHTDRTAFASEGRVKLDDFLDDQRVHQGELRAAIAADASLSPTEKEEQTLLEHFRLLQACDHLSLLACVAFAPPANLLHPLPLNNGDTTMVKVLSSGTREFRLHPWPFSEDNLALKFPSRHVKGKFFLATADLEQAFQAAPIQELTVRLTP